MAQSPYYLPPPPDESNRSSRAPSPYAALSADLIDLSAAYDTPDNNQKLDLKEFDPLAMDNGHEAGAQESEENDSDGNEVESWCPIRTDSPEASLYSGLASTMISVASKYGTLRRKPCDDELDSPVVPSLCDLPIELPPSATESPILRRPDSLLPRASPVNVPVPMPRMRNRTNPERSERIQDSGAANVSGSQSPNLLQDPFSLVELASLNTNRLSRCQSASSSLYPSIARPSDEEALPPPPGLAASDSMSSTAVPAVSPRASPVPSNSSSVSGVADNVLDYIANAESRELCRAIEALPVAIDNEGDAANPGLVYNAVTSQPFPLPSSIVIAYRFGTFLHERAPASPGSCIATGLPSSFAKISVNPGECDVESLLSSVIPWDAFPPTDPLSMRDFRLRIHGRDEFLQPRYKLSHHAHFQECFRLNAMPVRLILEHVSDLNLNRLRRTAADLDRNFVLPARSREKELAKETVIILLEIFNTEKAKFHEKVTTGNNPHHLDCVRLVQSVKAICAPMDSLMTLDVLTGLQRLETCLSSWRGASSHIDLNAILSRLESSIFALIRLYCSLYELPFTSIDDERRMMMSLKETISSHDCHQTVSLYVGGLHRVNTQKLASFDQIKVQVSLTYAGRNLKIVRGVAERVTEGKPLRTPLCGMGRSPEAGAPTPFVNVLWDEWLIFDNIPVAVLPLEVVLQITVFGVRKASPNSNSNSPTLAYSSVTKRLGWAHLPLFEADRAYRQGVHLVPLWPGEATQPAGGCCPLNLDSQAAVLEVALPELKEELIFPVLDINDHHEVHIEDVDNLPANDRKRLLDLLTSKNSATGGLPPEECSRLWHGRCYLLARPDALLKVLLAAPPGMALPPDIHCYMRLWHQPEPELVLQLLGPNIVDSEIRKKAVEWLRGVTPDELSLLLPQLIQILKYDIYATWSNLYLLLLEYSMRSPNFANQLYWLLKECPRGSIHARRVQILFEALLYCCGAALRDVWRAMETEVEILSGVAKAVRAASPGEGRDSRLQTELAKLYDWMEEEGKDLCPLRVPFNLGLIGKELLLRDCSYFSSFTCPLRLVFTSPDEDASPINIMFKAGDDLRQDALMLQLTEVMDRLWLREGLDLRMVLFRILSTGSERGFIELVSESTTLRKIQDAKGVTGPFSGMVIRTWLQRNNPSQLDYQMAVTNFLCSCAGCCVATYILGVGDRHNDNIMIGKAGHMVHIDYAKILGNAQTFAGIKRDRVPFVFTSEMERVFQDAETIDGLNGSQRFISLCCQALNILRHKADLLLGLARLLLPASMRGLRSEGIEYMRRALMLDQSDLEVTQEFTKLIYKSLGSKSTTLNFFIHGLAVSKHGGNDEGALLSFMQKNFSIKTDGKIMKVQISDVQKLFSPERTYHFVLLVTRLGWQVQSTVYREYVHFEELHKKLTNRYPLAPIPSLSDSSTLTSRANAIDRRKESLQHFINALLDMAPEISECDTVYTFFHSTLQDERDNDKVEASKLRDSENESRSRTSSDVSGGFPGEVELLVKVQGNELIIVVMHAKLRDSGGPPPDTYVKVYLNPDSEKQTKKKTRIVRQTFNPSFNEMMTYRNISKEIIDKFSMEVSVWEAGVLNARIGSVRLPLKLFQSETKRWYVLT